MRKVIEELVKKTELICDKCNKKITNTYVRPCAGCGCDLCSNCVERFLEYNPFYHDYLGDHPWRLCKKCSEKLEPIQEQADEINFEYEEKIEKLGKQWLKLCQEK